ncbi:hypothetical protein ACIBQ2_07175 [Micromonospora sediminimaris]|nr:hypothetical protein [Verrucosispora sp. WMMD1129]WFE47823.1 hypothetical protein O7624_27550 [Verrucosispora sp. WMMD1129]
MIRPAGHALVGPFLLERDSAEGDVAAVAKLDTPAVSHLLSAR